MRSIDLFYHTISSRTSILNQCGTSCTHFLSACSKIVYGYLSCQGTFVIKLQSAREILIPNDVLDLLIGRIDLLGLAKRFPHRALGRRSRQVCRSFAYDSKRTTICSNTNNRLLTRLNGISYHSIIRCGSRSVIREGNRQRNRLGLI